MVALAANQLINKIIQTKDYNVIKTNSLDSSYFVGYEEEFKFIEEHYKNYGNIPDPVTFLQKFENFEFIEVNEGNDFLLKNLYEEYGYHKFSLMIPTLIQYTKEDSVKAYEYLKTQMQNLKPRTPCHGVDIITQAMERYEKYLDRCKNQQTATIKTGLSELDDIFGGWEYGDELVTIVARTNAGKCLKKGTLVLMADGTYKKVEDIKVGDKVQSYNQVNTVFETHNGKLKGYKIIPLRGAESFEITDEHIMTVWHRNQIWDPIKKRSTTDGTGKLIDLTIEEYLSKSKSFQHNCSLYLPEIEYKTKQQTIPAYILGIWLGDGNSTDGTLTSMDENVYDEWINFGKSQNLEVVIKPCYNSHKKEYSKASYFKFIKGKSKINSFNQFLKESNLYNNKHIPLNYLTGDKEQRLELLAGIIDTDGYYDKRANMYEITTKSLQLSKDYYQLLRGLGFKVCKRISTNKKYNKNYYRISFSGALHEIPCRINYKKASMQNKNVIRNSKLTNFKVERIEEPFEYYGFACDGDHRFILSNGVLTHNSWILLKFLTEAWKQGKRVGLYSGEMNHIKLGYRFDALFEHISNKALVQGFQVDQYDKYIEKLIEMSKTSNACFQIVTQKDFGGRPTVQKMRSFIEENRLDILGIDQYSLMEDGRANFRDPTRLRLAHIAEDLFLLSSEYRIPILGLAQANRGAVDKDSQDAPGLENIKESDDISHNSSKCIGMRQSNFGLILDIIKNREGRVGDKLLYSWNIDTGSFSYIPSNDDAASPTIRQNTINQNRSIFQPSAGINPF